MEKELVMGIPIYQGDYKSILNDITKDIDGNKQKTIIAINPEKILTARKNPEIHQFINMADYQIPDGTGILLASKFQKGQISSRITGVDLMLKLCQLASEKKYKVFLYGASESSLKEAKESLLNLYPKLSIVGIQNGYEKDQNKIIKKISDSQANILFVALGSPKQERFIFENKDKLKVNILQGVGGSFDVISGRVKRAPIWMQNIGLEWLYRLIKEPKRIFRQFKLIGFLLLVFKNVKRGEKNEDR